MTTTYDTGTLTTLMAKTVAHGPTQPGAGHWVDVLVALVGPARGRVGRCRADGGLRWTDARAVLDEAGLIVYVELWSLVAPSTDSGWTPLFLTAGGLVMEMGGYQSFNGDAQAEGSPGVEKPALGRRFAAMLRIIARGTRSTTCSMFDWMRWGIDAMAAARPEPSPG